MSDDDIIMRGGDDYDIASYAENNGATDPGMPNPDSQLREQIPGVDLNNILVGLRYRDVSVEAAYDDIVKLIEPYIANQIDQVLNPNVKILPTGRMRKYEAAVRTVSGEKFDGELGVDYSLSDVCVAAIEEYVRLVSE